MTKPATPEVKWKLPDGESPLSVVCAIHGAMLGYPSDEKEAVLYLEAYAQKRAEQIQAERDSLMRDLVSLTVGGSEFVNDPKACVEYVRKRQTVLSEIAKNYTLRLIIVNKRAERLLAAAQRMADVWFEGAEKHTCQRCLGNADELRAAIADFQKGETNVPSQSQS